MNYICSIFLSYYVFLRKTMPNVFIVVSGGTLIVCPASLLNQWKNEMRTKLSPGLLKVGQYYGLKRSGVSSSELAENDIVTTSYNIVMWDFKKQQNTVSKNNKIIKILF